MGRWLQFQGLQRQLAEQREAQDARVRSQKDGYHALLSQVPTPTHLYLNVGGTYPYLPLPSCKGCRTHACAHNRRATTHCCPRYLPVPTRTCTHLIVGGISRTPELTAGEPPHTAVPGIYPYLPVPNHTCPYLTVGDAGRAHALTAANLPCTALPGSHLPLTYSSSVSRSHRAGGLPRIAISGVQQLAAEQFGV